MKGKVKGNKKNAMRRSLESNRELDKIAALKKAKKNKFYSSINELKKKEE